MLKQEVHGSAFVNPEAVLTEIGLAYGSTVADLGCGGGYFVIPAAHMVGEEGTVYAVDVLKAALSAVASKAQLYNLTNIRTVWSNVEVPGGARKIRDHSVDTVLLVQLLSQSAKHADIFREVVRILSGRGHVVVIDWKRSDAEYMPDTEKIVSSADVERLAAHTGLRLVQRIDAGTHHYGLLFGRK
ncbi:MAG: methyltransferase domain-containing protein [Patescibacteria group bacterium]